MHIKIIHKERDLVTQVVRLKRCFIMLHHMYKERMPPTCWSSLATNRTKGGGPDKVGKGGRKCGTGEHNGRKGVGTQGRRYVRVMMRESEGEEAVHA